MLNLSDKLTIYIFTFNRHHMLEGIVRYHSITGANIIVADASTEAWKIPADLVSAVDYRHTPNETHLERLRSVLPGISTPFFVFRSDRRHQTNRGQFQCVQYLEAHDDYASATGIWLREDQLEPYNPYELITHNGEMDCPYERVRAALLSYQPFYYNVQRTSHVVQIFKVWDAVKKYTTNGYYHEYVHFFFSLLFGKMKQLNCLAGIIQEVHDQSKHANARCEIISLMEDTALTQVLADILYTYLPYDTKDKKCFDDAISGAMSDAVLRLNFYGLSSGKQAHNTVGEFKKIFHILNSNGNIQDRHYLDASLRLLATMALEKCISYNDVRHLFTRSDLEEQQNILELINIFHKKSMLKKIREAKATIKR